ncbi:chitobiase/beta-hexosaminidase C-terminal domain-containing protein [Roseburia inulinivorans]
MMKLKHNFKKGMAFVLTFAMIAGLVPAMSGGADTVQAATGSGTEPSVTAYATKDQLMTAFTPDANGTATTKGKLVFGKNSYGNPQEWYILGADSGVSGGKDNTIIFAASPIATGQKFNSYTNSKIIYYYEANAGYGDNLGNIEVYPNHYGASDLRVALKIMATNGSYFTTTEQGLMNPTTVKTKDTKNNVTYTTTDKLYALAADGYKSTSIKAGTSGSTILAMSSYWSSGDSFWLRSPYDGSKGSALCAWTDACVAYEYLNTGIVARPASNLKLSSVLFASAAKAASSVETYGRITEGQPMILRLDGTGKDIGTVTYNTTTGNIKAVKGGISQSVALVVQGNDGTDDWFYSKTIVASETINTSTIKSALALSSDIDLSACKIWLETTDSTENLTYAVNATEAATSNIISVAITDIDTPAANTALDTSASCTTTGVSSTTPQITWTPSDSTAGYNTSYTASITLTAATGYEFTDSTTATVLGNNATIITKNTDGTLTVTYAFPATAKDKLTSITAPQAITVANGTAYDAMNLPATVNIVTEGNTASSAQVTWDTTTPESGSYDPAVLTQQTVTLNGMVACPDSIDANGVSLSTTITITISAAGIVGAPTANPTAGTYSENQSVALTSSTVGATIYYTTDGSEPTITGGAPDGTTQQYTAPIAVTGTVGQSITTTIKAIAVQNGMQDSSVETFTYTIKQDSQTPDVPVVTAPSITTQPGNATVKAGETATFTIAANGTDLTYQWKIDRNDGNGWVNIDGATAASYTTSTVDISCNGFKYQCVVSNSAGTDTSNTAVLTVTENTTPAPGSVDYEILDGANTSWEQNSDGSLSIRGSGAISKFVGVKVDGNLVDVKNYTVKEGSTIVTLKADYLNTISVGNHTFEIIWTDGTASTRFAVSKSNSGSDEPKDNDGNNGKNDNTNNTPATVPEDKNNNGTSGSQTDDNQQITSPKTGDNSHTVLWISLLEVSLAGLLSMIYVRKKKENK